MKEDPKMKNLTIQMNRNLELISFVKLDDNNNVCVLYNIKDEIYITALNIEIVGGEVEFKPQALNTVRYKAEKLMSKIQDEFYIKA